MTIPSLGKQVLQARNCHKGPKPPSGLTGVMLRHILRFMTAKRASPYRLHGRVWIEGPEGTFLGYGRVTLLERIAEHGSISAAARSMNMSYRHAWDLVDSMNRQAPSPLVTSKTGGKGGGGARLTPTGEAAIALFKSAWDDFKAFEKARSQGIHLAEEKP